MPAERPLDAANIGVLVQSFTKAENRKIFEKIGGKVVYFGKPHKDIYNLCLKKNERTLAIGDNLRTDIKGANNLNLDSIFITDGIHRSELGKIEELENLLNNYGVKTNFFQNRLVW